MNLERKAKELQKEETRERLYLAALEIFARDGVAESRVDDIAKAADVSRASFYFHFPTKENVIEELLLRSEKQVATTLESLPEDTPLEDILFVLCKTIAAGWHHDPKLFSEVAVVALKAASKNPDATSLPLRSLLSRRFQWAVLRREMSSEIPTPLLADFFLMNIFAALLAWSRLPDSSLDDTLQKVVKIFLRGTAPYTLLDDIPGV